MNINTFTQTLNILGERWLAPKFLARSFAKPATAALGGKKKKLGKLGPIVEKKEIPVETDANKLVNYVCGSNILKTGQDIKLKPDSEYPDWLWSLNVDRIIPVEEMDPETKQYWRRLRKQGLRRNNQLSKLKKF
ncbi:PREDICTED: 39S ribosomal protein L54, mitochondrial [Rhagoletis zephyria]|uniref:39S ribosomal protein L54, mitochondrial n=1 Tax=Rhagoletis zephyria TaxID=28612 RepID=UPI000811996D|nr:PREDICTED: 39S ribosomal protein L54, mitochondrial [Rhagoletis zephyria]XP_036332360.1 39S ribosomal protein L54, mitochondrial [Rhagoletis pomonella]